MGKCYPGIPNGASRSHFLGLAVVIQHTVAAVLISQVHIHLPGILKFGNCRSSFSGCEFEHRFEVRLHLPDAFREQRVWIAYSLIRYKVKMAFMNVQGTTGCDLCTCCM